MKLHSLLISRLLSRKLPRSLPGEARIRIFYLRRIIFLKMFLVVSYSFSIFQFPFSYSFRILPRIRRNFVQKLKVQKMKMKMEFWKWKMSMIQKETFWEKIFYGSRKYVCVPHLGGSEEDSGWAKDWSASCAAEFFRKSEKQKMEAEFCRNLPFCRK